jgi:hypothetical protein
MLGTLRSRNEKTHTIGIGGELWREKFAQLGDRGLCPSPDRLRPMYPRLVGSGTYRDPNFVPESIVTYGGATEGCESVPKLEISKAAYSSRIRQGYARKICDMSNEQSLRGW